MGRKFPTIRLPNFSNPCNLQEVISGIPCLKKSNGIILSLCAFWIISHLMLTILQIFFHFCSFFCDIFVEDAASWNWVCVFTVLTYFPLKKSIDESYHLSPYQGVLFVVKLHISICIIEIPCPYIHMRRLMNDPTSTALRVCNRKYWKFKKHWQQNIKQRNW